MPWKKHYVKYDHSFLSPSSYHWLNYDHEKLIKTYLYKDNKGRLCITQKSADNLTCYDIPFDMSKESGGKLPLIDPDTGRQLSDTSIDVPFVSKARWISEDTLYLELDLVGEEVGSIHITMNISDENLTVQMKKIVEARFEDFQGFLEGKRGK